MNVAEQIEMGKAIREELQHVRNAHILMVLLSGFIIYSYCHNQSEVEDLQSNLEAFARATIDFIRKDSSGVNVNLQVDHIYRSRLQTDVQELIPVTASPRLRDEERSTSSSRWARGQVVAVRPYIIDSFQRPCQKISKAPSLAELRQYLAQYTWWLRVYSRFLPDSPVVKSQQEDYFYLEFRVQDIQWNLQSGGRMVISGQRRMKPLGRREAFTIEKSFADTAVGLPLIAMRWPDTWPFLDQYWDSLENRSFTSAYEWIQSHQHRLTADETMEIAGISIGVKYIGGVGPIIIAALLLATSVQLSYLDRQLMIHHLNLRVITPWILSIDPTQTSLLSKVLWVLTLILAVTAPPFACFIGLYNLAAIPCFTASLAGVFALILSCSVAIYSYFIGLQITRTIGADRLTDDL